jgi:hypothetical protein
MPTITAAPTAATNLDPGDIPWATAQSLVIGASSVVLAPGQRTKRLLVSGFQLPGLPDRASIRSVSFSLQHEQTVLGIVAAEAMLSKGGFVYEDRNAATGAKVPSAPGQAFYGRSIVEWGHDFLTPSALKDPSFGCILSYRSEAAEGTPSELRVRNILMNVVYDSPRACARPGAGPVWAGTAAATGSWVNPGNAAGPPDGSPAVAALPPGSLSTYLVCGGFRLQRIPEHHEITGVRVTVRASVQGPLQLWHYLAPADGEKIVGRGKWPFIEPSPEPIDYVYGDCGDTWPNSGGKNLFTPAMFNNRTFKVIMQVWSRHPKQPTTVAVDGVSVEVWHRDPAAADAANSAEAADAADDAAAL